MAFIVGDTVKVRHDLIDGLVGTGKYRIKEDKGRWTRSTDMLVEMHDTVIESKHTINKIPGYGTVITLEDGTRIYQSKEGHVVQLSTNSTLS